MEFINWKDTESVRGVFSLKNPEIHAGRAIPGLNLGYNTIEDRQHTDRLRKEWLLAVGADPEKTAWGRQVHGTNVRFVADAGIFPETDGLVTKTAGLSLGIFVADCAAVLLCDEQAGIIAACHAGWRGAADGIVPKTVQLMEKHGADPSMMEAFISPCISKAHFEVGDEVAERFPETYVDRSKPKPHVELKGFVMDSLINMGINKNKISLDPGCSVADANRFYSYRREKEKSGRMMAVITLKPKG